MRLAALIAACAVSFAQVPQDPGSKAIPLSKVERKNKAPVSDEILRVKIPKPTEIDAPERPHGAGAGRSPAAAGHRAAHHSGRGRAERSRRCARPCQRHRRHAEGRHQDAIEQADRRSRSSELGATIGAQAPWASETATFTASGLSDNAGQWIPLASDILLNPSFPESELNKLKQRMKVQLQQQRSTAGFLMQERFNRAVYGDHPAAITSPTAQALDKITPAMLAEWHATRYVPENAILGIAGDITPGGSDADVLGLPGVESRLKQGRRCPPPPSPPAAARFFWWTGRAPCRPTSRSATSPSTAWIPTTFRWW